jgi:hypothetical protein
MGLRQACKKSVRITLITVITGKGLGSRQLLLSLFPQSHNRINSVARRACRSWPAEHLHQQHGHGSEAKMTGSVSDSVQPAAHELRGEAM